MIIRAKPTEKSKNSKNTGWNTEEKKKEHSIWPWDAVKATIDYVQEEKTTRLEEAMTMVPAGMKQPGIITKNIYHTCTVGYNQMCYHHSIITKMRPVSVIDLFWNFKNYLKGQ